MPFDALMGFHKIYRLTNKETDRLANRETDMLTDQGFGSAFFFCGSGQKSSCGSGSWGYPGEGAGGKGKK